MHLRAPRSLRVLVAPRAVFAEVLTGRKGFGALLGLLALELLLVLPERAASHLGMMVADPLGGLAGLWSLYVGFALKPAVVVFAVGTVLYLNQRRTKKPIELWTAASLLAYAWVPHLLLVAASLLLSGLGLDHPIMPHRRFDELGGGLALIKAMLEHGTTVYLGVIAWRTARAAGGPVADPPARRTVAWVSAGVAALMVAGLALNAHRVVRDWDSIRPLMADDPVPRFVVRALDGKSVYKETRLAGRVTLIDFWATWCPPCVAAMPGLVELHEELAPAGLEILSVNVEAGNEAKVNGFVREHRLPFPVYIDNGIMQHALKVSTFPTVFLIGPDGRVRHVHVGRTSTGTLRDNIEAMLADREDPGP